MAVRRSVPPLRRLARDGCTFIDANNGGAEVGVGVGIGVGVGMRVGASVGSGVGAGDRVAACGIVPDGQLWGQSLALGRAVGGVIGRKERNLRAQDGPALLI